jgi:pyruvate,orthophosphate dikinase
MTSNKKYVYFFGNGEAEGQNDQRDVLGGKGANLAEMTNDRRPGAARIHDLDRCLRPTTSKRAAKLLPPVDGPGSKNLKRLEQATGKVFGAAMTRCSSPCAPAPPSRCRA